MEAFIAQLANPGRPWPALTVGDTHDGARVVAINRCTGTLRLDDGREVRW